MKPIEKNRPYVPYKLQTDYFALGPNCTTLSIDGAKVAIPRIDEGSEKFIDPGVVLSPLILGAMKLKYGTPKRIFLPANFKKFLDETKVIKVNEYATYKK